MQTKEDYVPNNIKMNCSKRCPVVLCLDVSPYMGGHRIENLNRVLGVFLNKLNSIPRLNNCVEIAVVTFSADIETISSFELTEYWTNKKFSVVEQGNPNAFSAIKKSVELIENRLNEFENNAIEYYTPFLIIITDANLAETDNEQMRKKAIDAVKCHFNDDNLIISFVVGVGNQVNMGVFNQYADGFVQNVIISDGKSQSDDFETLFMFIVECINYGLHNDDHDQTYLLKMIRDFEGLTQYKRTKNAIRIQISDSKKRKRL